jgi:hypothetical protein
MTAKRIYVTLLSAIITLGIGGSGPKYSFVNFLQDYLDIKYSGTDFNEYLYVSVKKQRLYHIRKADVVDEYIISTAINGVGSNKNSKMTPSGLHTIKSKIGDNVPIGGIFESRMYSGNIASIEKKPISTGKDDITTRIMWLTGEEKGINQGGEFDSYNRHIYIHGTSEEGLLGSPASHGCVRMKNEDIMKLYEKITEGTAVIILNN